MKKRAILVSLFSSILIPSVYAATGDGSIVSGFNMTFGWVNEFLNSKNAVFGLMVILLFFLLYGIITTALKKTPLFGGKELDKAGKVVAISFSGIVVLSVFFVRNNAMEFAKTLAGAMNGFFALLLSGLVFLALKFTFKSEDQGELGGVKWENIIGFLGFILSLRMFAALMDSGPLKTVSVSLSYLSIIGMFVYVLLKNKDLKSHPDKDIDHRHKRDIPVVDDLKETVSQVRQEEPKLAQDEQRIFNAVAEAVKARPERREAVIKEAELAVTQDKKDVVQTEAQMRRIEKDVGVLLKDNQKIIEDKKRMGPPDPAEMKKLQEQADELKNSVNLARKAQQDLEQKKKHIYEILKYVDRLRELVILMEKPDAKQKLELRTKYLKEYTDLQGKAYAFLQQHEKAEFESMRSVIIALDDELNKIIDSEKKMLKESELSQTVQILAKEVFKGHGGESGKALVELFNKYPEQFKYVVHELAKRKATVEYDLGQGRKWATVVGYAGLNDLRVKAPDGKESAVTIQGSNLKIRLH